LSCALRFNGRNLWNFELHSIFCERERYRELLGLKFSYRKFLLILSRSWVISIQMWCVRLIQKVTDFCWFSTRVLSKYLYYTWNLANIKLVDKLNIYNFGFYYLVGFSTDFKLFGSEDLGFRTEKWVSVQCSEFSDFQSGFTLYFWTEPGFW